MFTEDELLPLSALQHLQFCERQCALIHVEELWVENRLTVEGRNLHQRAHEGPSATAGGVRITRGLPLRSLRLGLVGKADVVEFHPSPGREAVPFPVEYKRGRPKAHDADRVQLCAQALCLEEMLGCSVPAGALFYGQVRRRLDVSFDDAIRQATMDAAERLQALIAAQQTPRATREAKCDGCSLLDVCLPDAMTGAGTARDFVTRALDAALAETLGELA